MNVLNRDFLIKLKNNSIFFIIYSLCFIFIYKTFPYIAPFFIGLIIALIINPISQKLKERLNINKGISTLILSFFGVAIAIGITTAMAISGTKQLIIFLNHIDTNYNDINNMIIMLMNKASDYLENFKEISNINIEDMMSKYSSELVGVIKSCLSNIINFAGSIPYIVILIITLFISTYFIAKDIDKIEDGFYSMFTDNAKVKVKNIKKEIRLSILGYIRAYVILIGITFLVIWGSFSFFGVKYGFILGVIGGLLDLIPFLGIVVIFVPVIIYNLVIENYFVAISISIVFLALSIVRQILEPKLVSTHIGLNPLSTVIAIFIGVQVKGVIGIIFCLGLVAMHDILKKVEIL
ncbi:MULTISPECIES: sporulation integral membrane protein YtvI [unclassified Romboutsia]|uniref:sporulation integral membrane protein YtvI n=1 Tax=unclassified Romboutsia TaxID=2626894 RepID=UPI000821211A|nr:MULTISPECIES: sporulation integral membrane protein YtvI [unclassified Romboutsia]SCH30281.1 pheromone autoinducer 2 transporter [uncultured Clostridium sp.]